MSEPIDYRFKTLLHESETSRIYTGEFGPDNRPIILKLLRAEFPLPELVARFRQEYEIIRSLNLPGVLQVFDLRPHQHSWVMLLEDFGGISLSQYNQNHPLTLNLFLSLAIRVAETLGEIHQRHIIHKDINPTNIVYNPETDDVRIIDFGISTILSRENPTFLNPDVLEGTLTYMSPEQTGRMNRALDYRTDFYSLGVTFYELLTGRPPFISDDPLDLVHYHLAREPVPPHHRNPDIPQVISDMVMKLMGKTAEERYQSAYGLKADLESSLEQLQQTDHITPFRLGKADISDQFQIPQKLYGRAQETETLLQQFKEVSRIRERNNGAPMVLVSGYAGIGKSMLVQELYKPITATHGYFIAGKFDQFQRNIPYIALIQAFRSLISQLLTESDTEIVAWRTAMTEALHPNGAIISEVIPEIEFIMEAQPAVPQLPPQEAQNRFNLVFQQFIRLFTQKPLTIFLDDLQWADGASLKLLELLMTTPDTINLFLIGAYRHNEVDSTHALRRMLTEVATAGGQVEEIQLGPLTLPDITMMIGEALHQTPEKVASLAELVLAKTDGNPFFMNEFLRTLYADGLIRFVHPHWQWEIEQIQAANITANVVELMADKVKKLPPASQKILQLAACIGNQFDIATLSMVAEKPPVDTALDLREAVSHTLLVPLNEASHRALIHGFWEAEKGTGTAATHPHMNPKAIAYKFSHDRIQQAAYSMMNEADRARTHLEVGRLLGHLMPAIEKEQRIFDIVNQLNLGQPLLESEAEKREVAGLNLQAGRKAIASAAYEPAFAYLQAGLACMPPSSWQSDYPFMLDLHVTAAEAAYLSRAYDETEVLVQTVLHEAQTMFDKVRVYEVQLQAYIAQSRMIEALQVARTVLHLLGITLPEEATPADIGAGLKATQAMLAKQSIETLTDLPRMDSPEMQAVLRILTLAASPAYFAMPPLFPLIVFQQVQLSVQHGNALDSIYAYMLYGALLCGVGDIEGGYRFGQLALTMLEQWEATRIKARTSAIYIVMIQHWKEHLRDSLPIALTVHQTGLDTGDLEFAASSAMLYGYHSYFCGKPLSALQTDIESYSHVIKQLKQTRSLHANQLFLQVVTNLVEECDNPCEIRGEAYDEGEMLPQHIAANDHSTTFRFYFNKMVLNYLFYNYAEALTYAELAEPLLTASRGMIYVPLFYFYDALTRVALYPQVDEETQPLYLDKVMENQTKLERWAIFAPMNHHHKFALVAAERCRVVGLFKDAREYYDQAIDSAHEHGYINEEALACELAAEFHFERGQTRLGNYYLRDTCYAYSQWGASTKIKTLQARHPQFFAQHKRGGTIQANITHSPFVTEQTISSQLDLNSVVKASQVLSSEIVLDKLLDTLMKIVTANAGAEKSYLILCHKKEWTVQSSFAVNWHEVTVVKSLPLEIAAHGRTPILSAGVVNYVIRTQKHVVLSNAAETGDFINDPYISQQRPKSVLCAPLSHQGKLTGVLYMENNLTADAFTPARLQVLNLLSSQAAISIQNAALYAHLEQSERKYRSIFEETSDTIFVTGEKGRVIDVNPAGAHLFGYTPEELVSLYAVDIYVNPDDYIQFQHCLNELGVLSGYEVQLKRKNGQVIDALVMASVRKDDNGKTLGYQGIIQDVTERKRAEQERLKLNALQHELDIAYKIQQSLLPPTKPAWEHLAVFCYTKPAKEVGGDFFTYHHFNTETENIGKYGVAVGDVSGKGVPAALLMAVSLASFQSIIGQTLPPAELFAHLDQSILPYTRTTRQNCAMIYVEFDLVGCYSDGCDGGVIQVVNGGCVLPILRRGDGFIEWLDVGGTPLGIGLGAQSGYQTISCPVTSGDLVILTSDGVVEANNPQGEMFGFDRLEGLVRTAPTASAAIILDYLKQAINDFMGSAEPHDDITIVVIQV